MGDTVNEHFAIINRRFNVVKTLVSPTMHLSQEIQFQYHGGQNLKGGIGSQSKASESGTPSDQAPGCFWSRTLRKKLIWAQILISSDCKTPWLDSHPGPRFRYHGGQNTFVA